MNRQEYLQYLRSPEWAARRKRSLILAEYRCQECGAKNELEVHHVTYENLGHEKDNDLIVLCNRCHEDEHFFKDQAELDGIHIMQIENITEAEYQKAKEVF